MEICRSFSSNIMEKKVENIFKCEICEEIFSSSNSKDQHVSFVHIGDIDQEEQNICKICAKPFVTIGTLKTHMKNVHEGQNNYKCNTCSKTFVLLGSVKRMSR